MIMMLDFVAQRYGILPSQLMLQGSSFDIFIAEMAQRYQNRVAETARTGRPPVPDLDTKTLQAMMDRVRSQDASKNSQ